MELKYNVKIKDGDKEINEEIKVDIEKKIEIVIVIKMDVGNVGDVKVIYDFEKVKYNVCMIY